ncbi:response regulator transcription factor [Corynebacterium breve]|uniref:Response regulator transcription factor n=1 Tax=Corynebacterium breve TaxID=3049799 RepID=A0ABY8VFI0_9CORY|nr:response regulator transcription factor [Corynebacterium breve]WIM68411.1 response regulator transcription factor [Corynebacterium breve]
MIKAVLIDDHEMLLRGLSLLFETIEGIDIVATTTDGAEALTLAHSVNADIVITDAAMPGTDGLGVVKLCANTIPVLVLTTFDDARLVRTMIEAGAAGYILKDVAPDELANAIRAAASDGLVLDPRIARHAHSSKSEQSELAIRTRAERGIAELVAEGLNNREIAAALFLAEGTVKNHVSALLRKLGARDRTVLALRLAKSLSTQPGN